MSAGNLVEAYGFEASGDTEAIPSVTRPASHATQIYTIRVAPQSAK